MPDHPPGPPPPLPVEVYQDIFQRAIGSSLCEYDENQFWQDAYTPLGGCQSVSKRSNASARCKLLLVCQLWHSVAQRIAYETIFVGKHAPSLLAALTRSAKKNNGAGYGQFVRKIVFCARDKKGVNKTTLTRLLAACPHVTTIIREAQDFSTFPVSLPSFPSLRRLDWWGYYQPPPAQDTSRYYAYDESESIYTTPKPTTKGTNTTSSDLYLFRDIIAASPNLKYLSIGVEVCSQPFKGEHNVVWNPEDSLIIPVTTVRLETTVPWITRDINRWTFPNLEHLIINSQKPVNTCRSCKCDECQASSPFPHTLLSDRIRKLEFTEAPNMPNMFTSWQNNDTSTILSVCKNVTEVTFHFSADILRHISSSPTVQLRRLHTLRLRISPEQPWSLDWAIKQWEGIKPERLPALRRVILVGGGKFIQRPSHPGPSLYRFFINLSKRMGPGVTFLDEDGHTCSFDQSLPDVRYSDGLQEDVDWRGPQANLFPNPTRSMVQPPDFGPLLVELARLARRGPQ